VQPTDRATAAAWLPLLEKHAYCIQGCWVLKSSAQYKGQMELLRNYLMCLLWRQREIVRDAFTADSHLSLQHTTLLLGEMAVAIPGTQSRDELFFSFFFFFLLAFHVEASVFFVFV
jgi:hypothetical protein